MVAILWCKKPLFFPSTINIVIVGRFPILCRGMTENRLGGQSVLYMVEWIWHHVTGDNITRFRRSQSCKPLENGRKTTFSTIAATFCLSSSVYRVTLEFTTSQAAWSKVLSALVCMTRPFVVHSTSEKRAWRCPTQWHGRVKLGSYVCSTGHFMWSLVIVWFFFFFPNKIANVGLMCFHVVKHSIQLPS